MIVMNLWGILGGKKVLLDLGLFFQKKNIFLYLSIPEKTR